MPQPKDFKAPKYRNIVRRSQRPKATKPKDDVPSEPPSGDWRERRAKLLAKHAAEIIETLGGYKTPLETGD